MASLKPIETVYNGYRFRSRLEARWAKFFSYLQIPYEYEPQGYDLGSAGWYLPDFWLPAQECWIEIKPSSPSDKEEAKMKALVLGSEYEGFIFWGNIPVPLDHANLDQGHNDSAYALIPVWDEWREEKAVAWDNFYTWCECPWCGLLGIQFDGRAARLPCECHDAAHGRGECHCNGDKCYSVGSKRLTAAYNAARMARFGT